MNISSSLFFPFFSCCNVCIMKIITKKWLYLYKNFNLSLPLGVLHSCAYTLLEGRDVKVLRLHNTGRDTEDKFSIELQDMLYWNISWHWILTTRSHLWYDDENIQWKFSRYKHETYIKNKISLFHKGRPGLS